MYRQQLKQHKKCPACHMTVYEWDMSQCGNHSPLDGSVRRKETAR
jgi:hypothetical protein